MQPLPLDRKIHLSLFAPSHPSAQGTRKPSLQAEEALGAQGFPPGRGEEGGGEQLLPPPGSRRLREPLVPGCALYSGPGLGGGSFCLEPRDCGSSGRRTRAFTRSHATGPCTTPPARGSGRRLRLGPLRCLVRRARPGERGHPRRAAQRR